MKRRLLAHIFTCIALLFCSITAVHAYIEAPDPPISGGRSAEKQEASYIYGQWDVWVSADTLNSRAAHQLQGSLDNGAIDSNHSLDFTTVGNQFDQSGVYTSLNFTPLSGGGVGIGGFAATRLLGSDSPLVFTEEHVIRAARRYASSKTANMTNFEVAQYIEGWADRSILKDAMPGNPNRRAYQNFQSINQGHSLEQLILEREHIIGNNLSYKLADRFNETGFDAYDDEFIDQIKSDGSVGKSKTTFKKTIDSLFKVVREDSEGRIGRLLLDSDTYKFYELDPELIRYAAEKKILVEEVPFSRAYIRQTIDEQVQNKSLTRKFSTYGDLSDAGAIGSKSGFLRNIWGKFTQFGSTRAPGFFRFVTEVGGRLLAGVGTVFAGYTTYVETQAAISAFNQGNILEGVIATVGAVAGGAEVLAALIYVALALLGSFLGATVIAALEFSAGILLIAGFILGIGVAIIRYRDKIIDFYDKYWVQILSIGGIMAFSHITIYYNRDVLLPIVENLGNGIISWWGRRSLFSKSVIVGIPTYTVGVLSYPVIINTSKQIVQWFRDGLSNKPFNPQPVVMMSSMDQLKPCVEPEKAWYEKVWDSYKNTSQAIQSAKVDLYKGAGKGLLSTITGMSSLGERGIRGFWKIVLPKSAERYLGIDGELTQTSGEVLIPEEYRSITEDDSGFVKAGFYGEQIAEFFIPAGSVTKVSKASQASKLLTKAPKWAKPVVGWGTAAVTEAGFGTFQLSMQQGEVTKQSIIDGGIIGATLLIGGPLIQGGVRFLRGRYVAEGFSTGTKIHKNSLNYIGETHVYAIYDEAGNVYKYGESAQGVRARDGASIRGEQQARQRMKKTGEPYFSEIIEVHDNKRDARHRETHFITNHVEVTGSLPPGNKVYR